MSSGHSVSVVFKGDDSEKRNTEAPLSSLIMSRDIDDFQFYARQEFKIYLIYLISKYISHPVTLNPSYYSAN